MSHEPSKTTLQADSTTSGKRAPRKSKSDALAALMRASSPPLSTSTTSAQARPSKPDMAKKQQVISPPLDFATVRTTPLVDPAKPGPPRAFGLEDAPAYFPTLEQFRDPLAYISSISEEAQKCGIVKIIPPNDWKMPFVTDTTTFRFKTRVQRLNSIEASSRAKINFLEQLYRFHERTSIRPTVPTISHKPLDLWVLRKEVHKRGGFEHVNRNRLWGDISRVMGYDGLVGVTTQLKNAFSRIIHPFDTFVSQVRGTALPGTNGNQEASKYSTRSARNVSQPPVTSRMGAKYGSTSTTPPRGQNGPDSGPVSAGSKSLSPMPADGLSSPKAQVNGRKSNTPPLTPQPSSELSSVPSSASVISKLEDTVELPFGDYCEVCKGLDNDEKMLLCDGCERGFHTYCLDPPLAAIPKGQWYCHSCVFDTDYGFDEGEDHSLLSFQARASGFRKKWFEKHKSAVSGGSGEVTAEDGVSERDVELEFWRLVESPKHTVEVEYGADVHSTTHGSAMPTMETHPLNPYSRDPWNLNNIPILPDSLLRYIKSDISGMTVPWTYVGMLFSTFCWHNEDHYTYSINYMHWGETKTWYGIPAEDAEKFETAIKKEAPDLFEAQPDLLFQLVTLMHPERIREAGVRVCAVNQRPGEFVITFPQAYHAGFNHGFNFNEAVNFALPAWLPFGYACARRYREHQKVPVFSHDELLLTITQYSDTVKSATWVHDSLQAMTDRELKLRKVVRELVVGSDEVYDPHDKPEEQYQCSICKSFCYLSQVTCTCSTLVACLDHAKSFCICIDPLLRKTTLRTRFTDEELRETLGQIKKKRDLPQSWVGRLHLALEETPQPSLRTLKALLQEAESTGLPQQDLYNLQNFVNRANAWVSLASQFIAKKSIPRKRARKSRGPDPPAPDPTPEPAFVISDAYDLLKEADTLGFDCPERSQLANIIQEVEDLRARVSAALALPEKDRKIEEFEVMLSDCKSMPMKVPELADLEAAVSFLQLLRELDEVDDNTLTLDYVEELLGRARANNMEPHHDYYVELEKKQTLGRQWKQDAANLLARRPMPIQELAKIAVPPPGTPTVTKTCKTMTAIWSRAKEYERQAKAMLSTVRDRRTTPEEALSLIEKSGDFAIPSVEELRAVANRAKVFSELYQAIAQGTYTGTDGHPLESLLDDLLAWRTEIRQDLSMMNIEAFTLVDESFAAHESWLRSHPWYRPVSAFPSNSIETFREAFQVLQDVISETRTFDEDIPGPDCTCICTDPVRISSGPDAPSAVQCDSCGAKFHSVCMTGSCPFCDVQHWDGQTNQMRNFSLQDLLVIAKAAPELSKHYSAYHQLLNAIITSCTRFAKNIDAFLRQIRPVSAADTTKVIPQIRHIMRKLYVIRFRINVNKPKSNYGAELAVLHRSLAGKSTLDNHASRPATHSSYTSPRDSPYGGPVPDMSPHGVMPIGTPIRTLSSSTTHDKNRWQMARPNRVEPRQPLLSFRCEIATPGVDGCQCVCEGEYESSPRNPALDCHYCRRKYHHNCVVVQGSSINVLPFICPVCCVSKGSEYPEREVRIRHDGLQPNEYVDFVSWFMWRRQTMPTKTLLPPNPMRPVIILHLMSYTFQSDDNADFQGSAQSSKAARPGRPPLKKPAITKNRPVDLGSPIDSLGDSPNPINGAVAHVDVIDPSLSRSPERIRPPSPSSARITIDALRNSLPPPSNHSVDRSPSIRSASRAVPTTPEREREYSDDVGTRNSEVSTPVHLSRKRKAPNDVSHSPNSPPVNGNTLERRGSPINVDEYDDTNSRPSNSEQPQKIRRLGPVAVEALLT
ncbi:PLU-1-like protein-domain-containing protein [Cantharellus anzutake]|uniref:PLU-1-like protein-domain-containing protein n=1 Tax=Cantharellus anzutake TaxID=1750568 RepID=UPI00190687E1|nr:PLU-1-like protein-domain-containing protein [Cantharellus anzutake]KAF8341476.1 PLU-1-like protein-domain-containing protein [Cantharellus anzutake]